VPDKRIHVTGNTVVDALRIAVSRERGADSPWPAKYAMLGDRPLVLVTGHRRENFGPGLASLCQAIRELAARFGDAHFLYPVHLNPQVQQTVRAALAGLANVHLTEPAPYGEFVWLMDRSALILSDSGGIQEEAPTLGKRVLVARDTTERPEALETGLVELVGTCADTIVERATALLQTRGNARESVMPANPFGDGQAARRIAQLIADRAWTA
jgi:UDP-N-acetylglucosamine 2-epimerase (non-hydrolysing)